MGYKHAANVDSVRDILSVLREFVESSKRLAVVCLGNATSLEETMLSGK